MGSEEFLKVNNLIKGLHFFTEENVKKVLGHPLSSFYSEEQKVSQGRILLVGDAAHLIDPLTGEGIYYAIRSGMLAAEAILQSKRNGVDVSNHYQGAVKNILFEDLKWAQNVSRFIYRFTKLAYQTLKKYPELGNVYIQVLEGAPERKPQREAQKGFGHTFIITSLQNNEPKKLERRSKKLPIFLKSIMGFPGEKVRGILLISSSRPFFHKIPMIIIEMWPIRG